MTPTNQAPSRGVLRRVCAKAPTHAAHRRSFYDSDHHRRISPSQQDRCLEDVNVLEMRQTTHGGWQVRIKCCWCEAQCSQSAGLAGVVRRPGGASHRVRRCVLSRGSC